MKPSAWEYPYTPYTRRWTTVSTVLTPGMCRALGLSDRKILILQEGTLKKITAYVPAAQADDVRRALFSAGAGAIGNYDSCSYNLSGTGTFRALEGANPFVGDIGELHHETEEMISAIFPRHCQPRVIKALLSAHLTRTGI